MHNMNIYTICLIVQFLDLKDICRARRLDIAWRNRFQESVVWNYVQCEVQRHAIRLVLQSFPHARKLQLRDFDVGVEIMLSSLREFTFTGVGYSEALQSYLDNHDPNTTLRRLELTHYNIPLATLLKKFPQLTSLYLRYETNFADLEPCGLTSFGYSVEYCEPPIWLAKIKSLSLFRFRYRVEFVKKYFSVFKSLVSLRVPISSTWHLIEIAEATPALRKLTVVFHGISTMSQRIEAISTFGARLKGLSIRFSPYCLIDKGFNFADNMRKLTALEHFDVDGAGGQFPMNLTTWIEELNSFSSLREVKCVAVNDSSGLISSSQLPASIGKLRYIEVGRISKVFY